MLLYRNPRPSFKVIDHILHLPLATVQVEVMIYAKWLHCSDVKQNLCLLLLQTPTLSFCKINLITALNHPLSSCDYWENGRFMSLRPSVPRKEGRLFFS